MTDTQQLRWWSADSARARLRDADWITRLRVLVTGYAVVYLLVRAPHLWDVAALGGTTPGRWSPVGPLVAWEEPWPALAVRITLALAIAAATAATLGRLWAVTGPTAAIGVLLLTSYRSSWGQIFHTENLLVLHLLILAAVAVADPTTWRRDARELAPQAMVVVLVVAYVLAAWAKLRIGGLDWVTGDALRNHVAHDNLRKALVGDWYSPLGAWALAHGWVFPPLAAASVAVEIGSPAVLWGGRVRTAWVIAAWAFHAGVLALMAILFPYQSSGVAFACCWAARPLRRGRRSP